jgi:hypothetical protein
MERQFVQRLTQIDRASLNRSIFSAAVLGTSTLHVQLVGNPSEPGSTGILGVVLEEYGDVETERARIAALSTSTVSLQPDRELFPLRRPACVGDCNADFDVTVDELMLGVNISLGEDDVDTCVAFDADVSENVTVDEVITGLTMGLEGCVTTLPRLPAPPEEPEEPRLPEPTAPGGDITILAVVQADGTKVEPVGVDDSGRPIYERPFGDGFMVVFEARAGSNHGGVKDEVFSEGGLPRLQMIVSRDLGDGSEEVCDLTGGVPATDPLVFDSSEQLEDVVNDLGCRAQATDDSRRSCTRLPETMTDTRLTTGGGAQFCLPIARTWAFPVGETIIAARARDNTGIDGPVAEMVVRVLE